MDSFQKISAGSVQKSVKLAAQSAKNMQHMVWSIAENVQRLAGSVQKNAEECQVSLLKFIGISGISFQEEVRSRDQSLPLSLFKYH